MSLWSTLRGMVASALPLDGWDTAGGDEHVEVDDAHWDGGRYLGAKWVAAHPGRVGRAIRPFAATIHTTDMAESTFEGLVRAWNDHAGEGNAAHFIIGRTPKQGVVQMVDVGRNGNHAGGKNGKHGWLVADGKRVHPNAGTLGIEVHCAGHLMKDGLGRWRMWKIEGGRMVPHLAPIPDAEVMQDPRRRDRGWHLPTQYQLRELDLLLRAFPSCPAWAPPPKEWSVVPFGDPQSWAPKLDAMLDGHRVPIAGHVTLSPGRKTDPGLPLSQWLSTLS